MEVSLAAGRLEEPNCVARTNTAEDIFGQEFVARGGYSQVVIPAQPGIHFDVALDVRNTGGKSKIKMDPSVRWDDGQVGRLETVETRPQLTSRQAQVSRWSCQIPDGDAFHADWRR